ncbi:hypothetical protein EC991_005572 [Linnemannia zychae]|nr:hypothetical protein EC991_005572 [Linnemannia zychae]
MDQDGLVAGPAGRLAKSGGNEKTWNMYGRPASPSSPFPGKNGDRSSQDLAAFDTSIDQGGASDKAVDQEHDRMDTKDMDVGDNNNKDNEGNLAEDYFEDDEYEMDGGGEDEGSDQDDDDYLLGLTPGATPQEAYVDIWNEGSDILSEDDLLELEEDYNTIAKARSQQQQQQQQSLVRSLDSNTKYMTYLPYAGLTNQFFGMLRAIMVAKSLGRTLILPPITASSHEKSKQNQPWSDYFDLDTFMQLTGVELIELKDLRQADRVSAAESLNCHITCGLGSLRPLDFTAKEFLRQWKFDLSMTQLEIETTEFNELIPELRSQENEHMLCITNGYKIVVPQKEEWDLYGRYFYFTPAVQRYFSMTLEKLSLKNHPQQQHRFYDSDSQDGNHHQQQQSSESGDNNDESGLRFQQLNDFDQRVDTNDQPNDRMTSALTTNTRHYNTKNNNNNNVITPNSHAFISIHARRADFIDYCQQQYPHALSSCLPTTQELASSLNDLLVSDPSLRGLPVYVSTNEDRSEELAEFRAMGWQVLEDSFLGASERLGVFGPMMMDQVFMSQAQALVGVRTSTFSRVGAYRQEDWYGHRAVLMVVKSATPSFTIKTASASAASHIRPSQIRFYARPPPKTHQKTTFNSTSSTTARAPKTSTTSNIITFLAASSLGVGAYLYQWNQHRSSSGVMSSNPFFGFFSSPPETLTTEKWTPIALKSITPVSSTTSLFEFQLPAPCTIPISSAIYVKDDQIQAMRAYTPVHSTEADQETVQLLIKKYSEGQVSRFMHSARVGQMIEMRGPVVIWPGGREDLKQWDEIGMVAGGTGITAFMPIIHSALTNPDKKVNISLLFASQSPEELYFKEELDYLVKTFPNQLRVSYTVDKTPTSLAAASGSETPAVATQWEGHVGFVNQGMLQGLIPPPKKAITQGGDQEKEDEKKSIVLVCGPESMVNHVAGTRGMSGQEPIRGVLGAMGYQREQVFRFPN